jgi:hypothetical protein
MPKPYPWFYTVNDRPVKIVQLPDGGADCLVFDFTTGGFFSDRGYFTRVSETGIGKDVDSLTEQAFDALVASLRRSVSEKRQAAPIVWEHTGDREFPYRAEVAGKALTIRINDFPDEPAYTLLVEGQEVEDLEEWPPAWVRPAIPQALLHWTQNTETPE